MNKRKIMTLLAMILLMVILIFGLNIMVASATINNIDAAPSLEIVNEADKDGAKVCHIDDPSVFYMIANNENDKISIPSNEYTYTPSEDLFKEIMSPTNFRVTIEVNNEENLLNNVDPPK